MAMHTPHGRPLSPPRNLQGNCISSSKKSTSGQEIRTGSARKRPKGRGKLILLPGQARIVEYFGKKDRQEVRKSLSPTQGASNGPLLGVLGLCSLRKPSAGGASPFPEERGGVRDIKRLQKRTRMVLDRWPHSQESRQESSGGSDVTTAGIQGGSQERKQRKAKIGELLHPQQGKEEDK